MYNHQHYNQPTIEPLYPHYYLINQNGDTVGISWNISSLKREYRGDIMEYIEPRHSQCPQTRVIKCQSPKQHVYRSMVSCFSDQTPWISSESKPWHPTLPKMVGWWMLIPQSYQAPYGIGYSPGDSMGLNQKPRLHQQVWLVVSTRLKNMKVSWDYYSRYMEK